MLPYFETNPKYQTKHLREAEIATPIILPVVKPTFCNELAVVGEYVVVDCEVSLVVTLAVVGKTDGP